MGNRPIPSFSLIHEDCCMETVLIAISVFGCALILAWTITYLVLAPITKRFLYRFIDIAKVPYLYMEAKTLAILWAPTLGHIVRVWDFLEEALGVEDRCASAGEVNSPEWLAVLNKELTK